MKRHYISQATRKKLKRTKSIISASECNDFLMSLPSYGETDVPSCAPINNAPDNLRLLFSDGVVVRAA